MAGRVGVCGVNCKEAAATSFVNRRRRSAAVGAPRRVYLERVLLSASCNPPHMEPSFSRRRSGIGRKPEGGSSEVYTTDFETATTREEATTAAVTCSNCPRTPAPPGGPRQRVGPDGRRNCPSAVTSVAVAGAKLPCLFFQARSPRPPLIRRRRIQRWRRVISGSDKARYRSDEGKIGRSLATRGRKSAPDKGSRRFERPLRRRLPSCRSACVCVCVCL